MRQPLDELDRLQHSRDAAFRDLLARLAKARLKQDNVAAYKAEDALADLLRDTQAAAEVIGRRRIQLEAESITRRSFQEVPPVPFVEAIEALIERVPALARGFAEARERYQKGAFALARSSSEVVTRHVQKTIAQAMRLGQARDTVTNEIAEALGARDFSKPGASFMRSYADTVFRTTTASAYAEGRQRQADDPAIRRVVSAWRYDATNDRNVRHNHLAADGFVAHMDDPVWNFLKPPLGFNCRCVLVMVSNRRAMKAGVVSPNGVMIPQAPPAGAHPDPGFKRG